ncbi:MAG: carbamoyltransferase [Oligoflexales bacterium]|nr:carbamoyltransferase [Oligoflexales bacterium]
MKRNYIGLSLTPHDPAIAIMNSRGEVVFAEAAERYQQNKRGWNCLPEDLIRIKSLLKNYCESGADIVVSGSWSRIGAIEAKLYEHFFFKLFSKRSPFQGYYGMIAMAAHLKSNLDGAGLNIQWQAKHLDPKVNIIRKYYDHHYTHAAGACYGSPYDEALCLVSDGIGNHFYPMALYHYREGGLRRLDYYRPFNFHSLGLFYSLICNVCGFDSMKGEEWKVMGLASYGTFDENIYKLLKKVIVVWKGRIYRPIGSAKAQLELEAMKRKSGEPALNSANLAHTAQKYFCELLILLLHSLHETKLSDNLILTGGSALNSSCNGIILENTDYRNLYVPSAPSDDGNAVGAAYLAFREDNPSFIPPREVLTPYLGDTFDQKALDKFIEFGPYKPTPLDGKPVHVKAAELLSGGKIVAWAQDRAEYGPRALGNRSILADPRDEKIKDRLNATVKFREEFRPFAPSILHEHGPEYFENYQESPYMERTLRFKKEVKERVPGVVHVDGTGRLQTVKRQWNQKYYDLISEFKRITGIPVVLNTSFNVMGKPIVHSVEDAFTVFNASGLDALIINDSLFEKK